jgi:translation initiation factor IF-2
MVVEAKLDKGRGARCDGAGQARHAETLATSLWSATQNRAGPRDDQRQGPAGGKRSALPVEVLGLSGVPMAGDALTVVENESRAREVAAYRQEQATKRTGFGAGQP